MLAIDTNLIFRYLTGDHPAQSGRARKLMDEHDLFVCTTVLLETEWVLRSAYGFAPAQVASALRGFAGLPNVTVESPGLAARALDWMEKGMDFAGALHLTKAEGCEAFVSFDRKLAGVAGRVGALTPRVP